MAGEVQADQGAPQPQREVLARAADPGTRAPPWMLHDDEFW